MPQSAFGERGRRAERTGVVIQSHANLGERTGAVVSGRPQRGSDWGIAQSEPLETLHYRVSPCVGGREPVRPSRGVADFNR